MMRHVVAVLMTVAIVAVSMPVINDAAADRSQKNLGTQLAKVETAAETLDSDEELGRNSERGPRRLVELRFPDESLTSVPVETLRIVPLHNASATIIMYAVEGHSPTRTRVDAVVTGPNNGTVTLGGTEKRTFVLELDRDDANNKVVRFTRYS